MSSNRAVLSNTQGDTFNGPTFGGILGGTGNTNNIINEFNIAQEVRPIFKDLAEYAAAASFKSAEVSDQPKCHEGTRIAILEHLEVWAATLPYRYPVKWFYGPAGSGKSTIFRTIAQRLYDQGLLLASFFFFRSSPGRNNANKFVATIAYQVGLSIPETRPFIERAIERDRKIFSNSLWYQAQELIITPLLNVYLKSSNKSSSPLPRILLIDGLDECDKSDRQCEILQVLVRITQHLQMPIAILIASRPEHHIRAEFGIGDLNKSSTSLFLDNKYGSDDDIRKYLTDRCAYIRTVHPFRAYLPTPWPPEGALDTLVRKASGQFIYASTVDKFISSLRHKPAQRLDICLSSSGPGTPFEQLDSLYASIFGTLDPASLPETLHLLGFLFLLPSINHLLITHTPIFLERMLALQPGDTRLLLFELESLLNVGRDDEKIRVHHSSLSDYLFDRSRSGRYWIDAESIYAEMAEKCIPHFHGLWGKGRTYLEDSHIFSRARPTSRLRQAIEQYDLTRCDPQESTYVPRFLLALQRSKFHDARELYCIKLREYGNAISPRLQDYFTDTTIRRSSIIRMFMERRAVPLRLCLHIFGSSSPLRHLLELESESDRGLNLFVESRSAFRRVIKDLLDDVGSEYFVNGDGYADAALHLLECMTEGSKYYITAEIARVNGGDGLPVEVDIAQTFAIIISRSAARHDLVQYIETHKLSDTYLAYEHVKKSLAEFRKRALGGGDTPLCTEIELGSGSPVRE